MMTSPSTTTAAAAALRAAVVASLAVADAVDLRHAEYPTDDAASSASSNLHLHDPVIILHGLLGSKRNFASLATSLSSQLGKPRKILALDLRNHGDNVHDWRADMSYESMARDVLGVMDREGIDRAVLVGHSMGGKVAASLSLLEPGRVGGLVVLDIAPVRYCPQADANWGAVKASIDAIAGVDLNGDECATKRDVDLALRSTLEDPALRAFVLTNLDQDRKGEKELKWKVNVEAISEQLEVIAGFDLPGGRVDSDKINGSSGRQEDPADKHNVEVEVSGVSQASNLQYDGDVFIIAGGLSRFVRQAHLPAISQYFPNYMLTTVRGAGHWVHAEAPDDTLALLKRYLDR